MPTEVHIEARLSLEGGVPRCDVLYGGVPRCMTKCDRGEEVSKLGKNSVKYFMDGC